MEKTNESATNAFIIKKYKKKSGPEAFLKDEDFEEFLVSVKKIDAQKLLGDEVFAIYPGGINIEKKGNLMKLFISMIVASSALMANQVVIYSTNGSAAIEIVKKRLTERMNSQRC